MSPENKTEPRNIIRNFLPIMIILLFLILIPGRAQTQTPYFSPVDEEVGERSIRKTFGTNNANLLSDTSISIGESEGDVYYGLRYRYGQYIYGNLSTVLQFDLDVRDKELLAQQGLLTIGYDKTDKWGLKLTTEYLNKLVEQYDGLHGENVGQLGLGLQYERAILRDTFLETRYHITFEGATSNLSGPIPVTINWERDAQTQDFRWGSGGASTGTETFMVPVTGGSIGLGGTLADTAVRSNVQRVPSGFAGSVVFSAPNVRTLRLSVVRP